MEREYQKARAAYLDLLREHLPAAYREHFAHLSDADLALVARTRRLWQWYIDQGPSTMGDRRKQSTGILREAKKSAKPFSTSVLPRKVMA